MAARKALLAVVATTAVVGSTAAATPSSAQPSAQQVEAAPSSTTTDYVVLYRTGVSAAVARAAIAKAGGTVVSDNTKVGYARVRSTRSTFAAAADASPALEGAARNRVIGTTRPVSKAKIDQVERQVAARGGATISDAAAAPAAAPVTPEPLANRQWDMRQIGATRRRVLRQAPGQPWRARRRHRHRHRRHAPRHRAELRRGAVAQLRHRHPAHRRPVRAPVVRRPGRTRTTTATARTSRARSPRRSTGSGSPASPRDVTLVNIRAGQDSGFFFLQPTLEALTYAGDIGVDVVNMSYYTDPWLYNCLDNPADSPAEQAEQRVIRRRHPAGDQLRPQPRRAAGGRRGQRGHRPRQPDRRRHQPRLPAGTREAPRPSTTPASPCRPRPAASWRSARPASAPARRTTPTTAPNRPTSRRPAVTSTTRRTTPGTRATPCSPPTRRTWRIAERRPQPGRHAEHHASWCGTARAPPARTTSTCRARRWRRRTPSVSRR